MSGEKLTRYLMSLGFTEEDAGFLARLGYWTAILRTQCVSEAPSQERRLAAQ